MNINLAQAGDKKINALRFVTGHDFSRAANATKEWVGFSPCGSSRKAFDQSLRISQPNAGAILIFIFRKLL